MTTATALAERPDTAPAPVAMGGDQTFSLLQSAVERGTPPETLEKLLDLQERVLERNARQAFASALAAFQAECPAIGKNKTVNVRPKQGAPYSYGYAELDHIIETIKPYTTKHGLSFAWDSVTTDGQLEVQCIIRHAAGHAERTTFSAPIDKGARMSDAQRSAAALSYARRYALTLALGLVTGEPDDDGRSAGVKLVTESQALDLEAKFEEVTEGREDLAKVRRRLLASVGVDGVDFDQIPAASFTRACQNLERLRT